MAVMLQSPPRPIPSEGTSRQCLITSPAPCSSLPEYTPSPGPPDYSDHPVVGELSLQNSVLPLFRRRNPAHTFAKTFGKMSITLRGQEPGVKVPWYGREEMISGFIKCEDLERVTSVKMQVEGKLSLHLGENISKVVTLVDASSVLWKKGESAKCPSQIEFAFMLPHTYESGGVEYPLPPSFYEHDRKGGHTMNLRSSYRIRVSVTKAPKGMFSWEKMEHAFLTFDYLPRSMSEDPTSSIPGCLANIKALPNEWYQAWQSVPVESCPDLEAITTNLFIPTARVYPVTDSIPFHIQISGRVDSLRMALLTDEIDDYPDTPVPSPTLTTSISALNLRSKKKEKARRRSPSPPSPAIAYQSHLSKSEKRAYLHPKRVRVYLIRQVRIELKGKTHVDNRILSEGTLESVPPMMSDFYCYPMEDELDYLSWSGELKCPSDVRTGGFEGENITVSDYVALAVGKNKEAPWMDIKNSISIRLVTDSWEDPPEVPLA